MRFLPLRLIPDNTKTDFMGSKWLSFFVSMTLILLSILFLVWRGLNFGIDFSGGILMEIRMHNHTPDLAEMRHVLTKLDIGEIALQNFNASSQDIMIRIGQKKGLEGEQAKTVELVKAAIAQNFKGEVEYRKIDYVGPQVGKTLIRNGSYAVFFSFLAIMLYIWARFEWQYGVGLLLALAHDAIVSMGFMSALQLEFNLTSIAAILTIIGYSVNDSVVIYDRIRENIRKFRKVSLAELINISINSTLSRTILTVVTTLLATLSLILFGGEAIRSFSLVVFFGIVIGTYSSIYISAPILIYLNLKK